MCLCVGTCFEVSEGRGRLDANEKGGARTATVHANRLRAISEHARMLVHYFEYPEPHERDKLAKPCPLLS